MNPSDVRTRVLAEHIWLSDKLSLLEASATAVQKGNLGETGRLRQRALEVCASVLFHLSTEDELLIPLLRNLDAWGEIRAERVESDHQAQRGEIVQLSRSAEHDNPTSLAEAALTFSRALRADMEHEESLSLGENLLRDDTISLDQLDA